MSYPWKFEYQRLLLESNLALVPENEIREGVKIYLRFLLTKIKTYKDDPDLVAVFEKSLEEAKNIFTPAEKEAYERLGPTRFAFY